ncbi:tRNA glutamyl-Q(34) synthetase GluQRS [Methylomonas sp. SURF-2]|uniref:Glutamyl-Q tRNA(Asp) synthetase n=1 Tax=Methylomonas subterranea TaxID=2952225 RepID=A0ABT1TFG9_9GAMM|nr:tRNA glutamyl-Q(34) synthetase GluQRS [Methylomonas sp. SURF-2]
MGRFAPSPTGPLHLGSLYTALASYLDARSHRGLWLLRIDDLDTPRNAPGAADAILKCLDRFQLHWDGSVYFQSNQLESYALAFERLSQQHIYACRCSRKDLNGMPVYPGSCRKAGFPLDTSSAWRLRVTDRDIGFQDALQGWVSENPARAHGDFIVRRRDGIVAYQFAVVIDDNRQGVNRVVRGLDLLDSTTRQRYLQTLLEYPQPDYMHLPLIVDRHGNKLSKQTLAEPVDDTRPAVTLFLLLQLLRQNPPSSLREAPATEILAWGIEHWQPQTLKKMHSIHPPELPA